MSWHAVNDNDIITVGSGSNGWIIGDYQWIWMLGRCSLEKKKAYFCWIMMVGLDYAGRDLFSSG